MIELRLPLTDEDVRPLHVGDQVQISGTMMTARDAAHLYMTKQDAAEVRDVLRGGMIYHCGPIVAKDGGQWRFVAAGPTTSIREEPYEADVIARYGVRGIIGKGGMGEKTLKVCAERGCVYLDAIGGLAVVLAQSVKRVVAVHKLEEFGMPEAMWVIEVEKFPAIVGMDAHGGSIYRDIEAASAEKAKSLISKGSKPA